MIPFDSISEMVIWMLANRIVNDFCFIGGEPKRKAIFHWIGNNPAVVDVIEGEPIQL